MPQVTVSHMHPITEESTHQGVAVRGFPDVCFTPHPPSLFNPVAYPSSSMAQGGLAAPSNPALKQAHGYQLRTHLQGLHFQLVNLPAGNPNRWHKLLDEYVLYAAALYRTLSD